MQYSVAFCCKPEAAIGVTSGVTVESVSVDVHICNLVILGQTKVKVNVKVVP